MGQVYQTEVKLYDQMQELQGKDIPRLFARLTLPAPLSSLESSSLHKAFQGYPAILLQYIKGFSSEDVAEKAPKQTWQHICDDDLRTVNYIGKQNIRNSDVEPRNFMVSEDNCKVYQIDFGSCVWREDGQDEKHWRRQKWISDEEGKIGRAIQKKLDGVIYRRSGYYLKLTEDFNME